MVQKGWIRWGICTSTRPVENFGRAIYLTRRAKLLPPITLFSSFYGLDSRKISNSYYIFSTSSRSVVFCKSLKGRKCKRKFCYKPDNFFFSEVQRWQKIKGKNIKKFQTCWNEFWYKPDHQDTLPAFRQWRFVWKVNIRLTAVWFYPISLLCSKISEKILFFLFQFYSHFCFIHCDPYSFGWSV